MIRSAKDLEEPEEKQRPKGDVNSSGLESQLRAISCCCQCTSIAKLNVLAREAKILREEVRGAREIMYE